MTEESIPGPDIESPKTKIVVHINNYILSKSPSFDVLPSLLTTATPVDNIMDQMMWSARKNRFSPKLKKVVPPNKNYIIVHAKSIKFPVKVTPSYEIYPTTNMNDDKDLEALNKYDRGDRRGSHNYRGSGYYNNRYDKYDINFRLPPINPLLNNQIKNNLTYPNKAPPKMTLPNYLKAQYNFLPANTLNYKPAATSQPIKTKEAGGLSAANNVTNHNRLESNVNKKSKINQMQPLNHQPHKKNQNNQAQQSDVPKTQVNGVDTTIVSGQADNPIYIPTGNNQLYLNPNSTFIEPSQSSFAELKLPHISKPYESQDTEFAPPNVTNHNPEISSRLHEESSRLYNISDQINDEIDKLIRNYPSIVVRRKGVEGGEKKKKKRKSKFPTYLSENQISYQKPSPIEGAIIGKPARSDISHTIDYGKLI